MSNYIYNSLWVCNYMPLFYMDKITYPYPNSNAGLANLC